MSGFQTTIAGLGDVVGPLTDRVDALDRVMNRNSQAPWIAASLVNGHAISNLNGWADPAYYRDASGRVYFRGGITISSNATRPLNIFQLQPGYRPIATHTHTVTYRPSNTALHFQFQIQTTGWVVLEHGDSFISVPLDTIQFRAL